MKAKTFVLAASAALCCACQPTSQGTCIEGHLAGTGSDTLLVAYVPVNDLSHKALKRDTLVLQEGKFSFPIGNDSVPTECYLYVRQKGNATGSAANKQIAIMAFPGQTVTVNGTMDNYEVSGNSFHAAWQKVEKEIRKPYQEQMEAIAQNIMQLQGNGQLTPERTDSLQKLYRPLYDSLMAAQERYIRQHPDDDVSVYLLSSMGSKRAKELLPVLEEKAREGSLSSLYQAMQTAIENLEARKAAKEQIVEGAAAPDFTLKDLEGKDLSLSSLRGKYVVLDFWGSWCGWCIKGIPDMKAYYAKYKEKMEILGIDCRDTEEKWKAAVEKHGLPWLHVRNGESPDVTLLYGIEGYPTKIVIDPEGKIAKVVVGEDPAFYEYLDRLFK